MLQTRTRQCLNQTAPTEAFAIISRNLEASPFVIQLFIQRAKAEKDHVVPT